MKNQKWIKLFMRVNFYLIIIYLFKSKIYKYILQFKYKNNY